ncbi:MAG: hypothetical protein Q9164_006911, partial [Protoblastenia rupestris]
DPLAWECALYYCVNDYKAVVRDGAFSQTVQNTWRNDSATHSQSDDLVYSPPKSRINNTGRNFEYRVHNLAAQALNVFMTDTFTGSGRIEQSNKRPAFSSDVIQALYEADDVPIRVRNLAVSMSNNMRQQNDSDSYPFAGTAYKTQTFLHVRWPWTAYPMTLLTVSVMCLFATIRQTTCHKVNAWKSSTLALLFFGQGLDSDHDDRSPSNTLSQMTQRSSNLRVELLETDNHGWRLVER